MAPSTSILDRAKKLLKRIPTWRPKKNTAAKQQATLPNKASLPEQPLAAIQKPIIHQDRSAVKAASTMPTLQIALENQTSSTQVYAYISELATDSHVTDIMLTKLSRPSHRQ